MESESPIIEWLMEHGKTILGVISALILILFLLFRVYSSAEAKSEKDYIEATRLESKIFVPADAEASLEELKKIVAAHPEVGAEYDGLMAQAYLNLAKPEEARPLIERTLTRIQKDNLPIYSSSSLVALDISEGKLDESYAKSLELKTQLSGSKSSLYYFNLLRIGMLEQALGKQAEEKATWEEFISASKLRLPAFDSLINAIDVEGSSIIMFIQERQKKLKA